MRAMIIAHGYATPVFQPRKHVLYPVALPIQLFVIIFRLSCAVTRRNTEGTSLISQYSSNPCCIIASVSNTRIRRPAASQIKCNLEFNPPFSSDTSGSIFFYQDCGSSMSLYVCSVNHQSRNILNIFSKYIKKMFSTIPILLDLTNRL